MPQDDDTRRATRADRLVARGRRLLDGWNDETDVDRAEALFRQAVALAPEDAAAWYGLGDALQEEEEPEQAIEAYQRAQTLGAESATFWRRFGTALAQLPQHGEAGVVALERARALAPDDIQVLDDYAGVLSKVGWQHHWRELLERARGALQHRLALEPAETGTLAAIEGLVGYGALLIALERPDEALIIFDRLPQVAGEQARPSAEVRQTWASEGRAQALEQLGRYDEALAELEKLPEWLKKSDFVWLSFRARLLARIGRWNEALVEAEKAVTQAGSERFAYPLLVYADVVEALGRADQATECRARAATRSEELYPIDWLLPTV